MVGRNKRKYLSDNDLSELVNKDVVTIPKVNSDGSELDFTSENEDSGNGEVDGDNEIVNEIQPGTWFMTGVDCPPFPFCGQPGLNMQIQEIFIYRPICF